MDLVKFFWLSFTLFGPKNSFRNPHLTDYTEETLLDIESPKILLDRLTELMKKTHIFAYKSFVLAKVNKKFSEEEIEIAIKRYLNRELAIKNSFIKYAENYNLNLSFPDYKDISKIGDKDNNQIDVTDSENKQIQQTESDLRNEKSPEDEALEEFDVKGSLREIFRDLRDMFETPVWSMVLDMFIHGPGNVDDVNLIKAMYRQYVLADGVQFTKEELLILNKLPEKSEKYRNKVSKINKKYGKGYDNKVSGWLKTYSKGVNTGGENDYKKIAEALKNYHKEKDITELRKTCPHLDEITPIFDIVYQLLLFKETREVIENAFSKDPAYRNYPVFFKPITAIGSSNQLNDLDKIRMYLGIYYSSRNKSGSFSVFDALGKVINQQGIFDKLMEEYKNIRKQVDKKEK